jgi:hypothetical protein
MVRRVVGRLLFLVAFVVVLSACRVEATVTVEVSEDGSGTVAVGLELDGAAVDALSGFDDRVRVDDLEAAGWEVVGPTTDGWGVGRMSAVKKFDSPDRLGGVLAEVAGPTAFRDVLLVRERSFARTTWRLTGVVDLSEGMDLLADPALAELLDGLPFARTEAELALLAGCGEAVCAPPDSFALVLVAVLPTSRVDDGTGASEQIARWSVDLGDRSPTLFHATGVLEDRAPRMWMTISVIAGGLLLLVVAFQAVRMLRARRGVPDRTVGRTPQRRRSTEIVEEPPAPAEPPRRELRLVVLGGIGVVWDAGGDPEGLLVPFVREQGGVVDPGEVADRYRAASLGQMSSEDFWASVGVAGSVEALDAAYLSRVRMRADVLPFLDRMEQRSMPVACLTNAVLAWSELLRRRFALEGRIEPWVASGGVGARKPSQAMFEALRRMSGVAFGDMLLIDSDPSTLEAARGLGMSTVLLRGTALVPADFGHPVIDGFADLFRTRET